MHVQHSANDIPGSGSLKCAEEFLLLGHYRLFTRLASSRQRLDRQCFSFRFVRAAKTIAAAFTRHLPVLECEGEPGTDHWSDNCLAPVVITSHLPLRSLEPWRWLAFESQRIASTGRRQGQFAAVKGDIHRPGKRFQKSALHRHRRCRTGHHGSSQRAQDKPPAFAGVSPDELVATGKTIQTTVFESDGDGITSLKGWYIQSRQLRQAPGHVLQRRRFSSHPGQAAAACIMTTSGQRNIGRVGMNGL